MITLGWLLLLAGMVLQLFGAPDRLLVTLFFIGLASIVTGRA